jgi:hypothetical protein
VFSRQRRDRRCRASGGGYLRRPVPIQQGLAGIALQTPFSFLERKGDRNRATLAVDRDERVFEIRGQEVTAA